MRMFRFGHAHNKKRKEQVTRARLNVELLEDRQLLSSIWGGSVTPPVANDTQAVELGMKFRSDQAGYIMGVSFYKGAANSGTHVGHLWAKTGGPALATATFSNETASGWQQVYFSPPVAISANTTYIASYYAPVGGYAFTAGGFSSQVNNPPLHALANTDPDGPNGVFLYATGGGFPNSSGNGTNYWVDVNFSPTPTPVVVSQTPTPNKTGVSQTTTVTATFNESVVASSISFVLQGPGGTWPATVSYDDPSKTATLTPSFALSAAATYTATVSGTKDAAGDTMTAPVSWSFTTSDPAQIGQWSQPINWPLVAINAALLDTGKVLMWDGGQPDNLPCIGPDSATIWDPATGSFNSVPLNGRNETNDIFCSGMVALPDGRIVVVGGHDCGSKNGIGNARTNIFDPATRTWTFGPDMTFRRWYPTATTLPDGRVLATSGADTTQTHYITTPELYDPSTNTWMTLNNAQAYIPAYPFIYVLPDGRVLEAGSTEFDATVSTNVPTRVLDLKTQTWTTVDASITGGGSSVMYQPGKVMKSGSAYDALQGSTAPSSANTYVLDMTQPNPAWHQTASMAFARTYENLTILPTGDVLATGGSSTQDPVNLANAVYMAESWNPTTQTWTTLASGQVPRIYHSTGLLLPDGRVLVAGGGRDFGKEQANETNAEIYSPPYLFKGPRPSIWGIPSSATYGSSFFVQTPDAANIASISLVRSGSVTHAFNMDQRFLNLTFTQTSGGLTVQAPANAALAPPGYYMLFLVNKNGVPSTAPLLQLTSPTVVATAPSFNMRGASTTANITVTFNTAMDATTISASSLKLLDPSNNALSVTVSYNATTHVATLALPQGSPLLNSTTYTIVVKGGMVKDTAGNFITTDFTTPFTTAVSPGTLITIWDPSAVPTAASANDASAYELGVKFRSDVNGFVTGVRFYKGALNTGTHIGRLWRLSDGAKLAEATFSGETASGWQQVNFSSPVAVSANTTYIASYVAPHGGYAINEGYFTVAGVNNAPLHALADGVDGGNGVNVFGAPGTIPNSSFDASNYWVDVVFRTPTAPAVIGVTPAANATMVPTNTVVTATFNESVTASSISFTLQAGGSNVPASVTYNDANHTATLTPNATLAGSTIYTATVSGATDLFGQTMTAPFSWSFTTVGNGPFTVWPASTVPAVLAANDSQGVELGMKFRADQSGYVTGVRFYKGPGNAGAHLGRLWSSTGQILASAAFGSESASGWQQVNFSPGVAINPNTTYVVSYYAPVGNYSYNGGYFATGVDNPPLHALANGVDGANGVYLYGGGFPNQSLNSANYWVDVVYSTAPGAPAVTTTAPAANATGVSPIAPVTATFNEPVTASSISFVLQGPGSTTVPATVSYNSATQTATLTPNAALANNTTYTATVSGATDAFSKTMAAAFTWSFTTVAQAWIQTTVADFSTGTTSGTTITNTSGGEVQLAPSFGDNFPGTALSQTSWTANTWAPAGGGPASVTVSGGILSVGGSEVLSTQTFTGVPVEGRINFGATAYQHFGLATDFAAVNGNYWAIFSTAGTNNTLFARVNNNGATTDVSLGTLPAGFHVYRVQPVSSGFQFYVDGVSQTTIAANFPSGQLLKIAFSAFNGAPQPALQANWVRTVAYPASGTFTSAVFDATRTATWGIATWTPVLPAGTTLTVQTRSGNTAAPDGTWSAWAAVTNGSTVTSPAARYLQYQLLLTTNDSKQTPILNDITFNWS